MPTNPYIRARAIPGCSNPVPPGRSACVRHGTTDTRHHDAARHDDPHRQQLRTARWTRYSVSWLRQHPLCGETGDGTLDARLSACAAAGQTRPAEVVDHVYPVSKGGSMWDPANHCSLCRRCNSVKGNRIPAGRAPGDDDHGLVLA
jgi:5-methylcytosine-specific restriction endonuclease McrA